jgi:hypothetical protein
MTAAREGALHLLIESKCQAISKKIEADLVGSCSVCSTPFGDPHTLLKIGHGRGSIRPWKAKRVWRRNARG